MLWISIVLKPDLDQNFQVVADPDMGYGMGHVGKSDLFLLFGAAPGTLQCFIFLISVNCVIISVFYF